MQGTKAGDTSDMKKSETASFLKPIAHPRVSKALRVPRRSLKIPLPIDSKQIPALA